MEQTNSGATAATAATSGLDEFLTRTENGTTQVYLTDVLGTVLGLANPDGTIATSYAYDPGGTPTASGATSSNPYTFTGREDDNTGLLYCHDRYYDPQTGRFISQDPIGQAGGTNLYQYALSSPTTYTDPTGNNPLIAGCVVGGLMDGGLDWLTQRLSGHKVNWGQVGQAAAIGCLSGMLGAGLGAKAGTRATNCNSFTADTPVVMADGTRKPIQDIQVGDSVLATDPETDDTGPRKVTALITGSGDKHFVDLTVDTDGTAGTQTATITATDGHPFWVPDLHQWIDAGDLTAGQWLHTSAGTWVQITALDHRTQPAWVYNLTVDDLHTYYIAAGSQDLLVHNSTCLLGTSRDIRRHIAKQPGDFDADFLNIPAMRGPGRWNWTRNKRFIDEALASGKPILLVTDPTKPLYTKGNVYQRELKYLQDKGYGWRKVDGYWEVVRIRP